MCAETLVDDEAIVTDAENRPFYKDTLIKIFMRSITIDAAKKEAKARNTLSIKPYTDFMFQNETVRQRLAKLIRESKKMLEKALGGAPDKVPQRTREMVDSQDIDPDELWPSHSKSVFPVRISQC